MNKKEFVYSILLAFVMGYVILFGKEFTWLGWLFAALSAFAILLVNITAKKLAAIRLGCVAEIKPWTIQRYWIKEKAYFKYPLPAWLLFPLVIAWISLGNIKWLALTVFDVKATAAKASHRWGEVTEWDFALIAAAGIAANMLLAIVTFALGYKEFALLNAWFIFFNMIPFPSYDGCKIFFGGSIFFFFVFAFSIAMLILFYTTLNSIVMALIALIVALLSAFVFWALAERPR